MAVFCDGFVSHVQIQTARELGMWPKFFGGVIDNNHVRWNVHLFEFIEYLYRNRSGKNAPYLVLSTEGMVDVGRIEKKQRKARRQAQPDEMATNTSAESLPGFEPRGGGQQIQRIENR